MAAICFYTLLYRRVLTLNSVREAVVEDQERALQGQMAKNNSDVQLSVLCASEIRVSLKEIFWMQEVLRHA